MPTKIAHSSDATVRRKERAVSDEAWIQDLLQRAPYGVMATVVEGRPFTVARNFAYDKENHVVYMHGARKGRTFTTVQTNDEPVCLNVSEMGRFLPGRRAMNRPLVSGEPRTKDLGRQERPKTRG
jgi:nitroimidazol reductase NimA-like FMN-containing flavoprotein (pyridoxamine 5'-phosphate oxidase superfamily)